MAVMGFDDRPYTQILLDSTCWEMCRVYIDFSFSQHVSCCDDEQRSVMVIVGNSPFPVMSHYNLLTVGNDESGRHSVRSESP